MRGLYFFCEMVYTTSEKNGKGRLPKKIKITDNSDADESVFYSICTMAEDVLTYFFIALYAGMYLGIPETVYNYRINTGVTSRKAITDLAEWEKVCSAASVFTIILSYLDEHPALGTEIRESLKALGRTYRTDNLKQLEVCVVPSLQEEARAMLDEWWGGLLIKN